MLRVLSFDLSWTRDMWFDALVRPGSGWEPQLPISLTATADTLQCAVLPVFLDVVFCVFASHHVCRMFICVLLLVRRKRQAVVLK